MNETVDKFLLAAYKFIPEIHLRHRAFIYSASRPFTKNKEKIQNLKKLKIRDILSKRTRDFKELTRRTASYKILLFKLFNIAKNPKKVIKTKDDRIYVKWKGYNNSFSRWIDKKDI